jgi:hypothetical protein
MAARSLLTLTAAAVGALVIASAGSATELTIYPGVGIGKVKLGMTAAQVQKAMGRDFIVNNRKNIAGVHYIEYGWDFAHWTVTFAQQSGSLSAVQVATDVHDQHTTKKVGYGTLWRALLRAYPGGKCAWGDHYSPFGYYVEYLVAHRGGTQTLFTLDSVGKGVPQRVVNYKVVEVRVRRPFEPYVEFGSQAQPYQRCADGWQNTDTPAHG